MDRDMKLKKPKSKYRTTMCTWGELDYRGDLSQLFGPKAPPSLNPLQYSNTYAPKKSFAENLSLAEINYLLEHPQVIVLNPHHAEVPAIEIPEEPTIRDISIIFPPRLSDIRDWKERQRRLQNLELVPKAGPDPDNEYGYVAKYLKRYDAKVMKSEFKNHQPFDTQSLPSIMSLRPSRVSSTITVTTDHSSNASTIS